MSETKNVNSFQKTSFIELQNSKITGFRLLKEAELRNHSPLKIMTHEAFAQLIGVVQGFSKDAIIMPFYDPKLMDYDVSQFKRIESLEHAQQLSLEQVHNTTETVQQQKYFNLDDQKRQTQKLNSLEIEKQNQILQTSARELDKELSSLFQQYRKKEEEKNSKTEENDEQRHSQLDMTNFSQKYDQIKNLNKDTRISH